ncbi:MAG: YtxH domain-containing protein [Abditibacteriaceae bacterium]
MSEQNQKSGGYIRGLVTGVLIGAGAALLLAPKRGEELREELAQNASEWKDKATGPGGTLADRAQELKDRAAELGQTVAQKAQEFKAKGKDMIEDTIENASDVVEDVTEHDAEESV